MNSQFKFPTTRIIFLSIPHQNQIKWKRIDLIKNGFTQAEFIFSIKRFGLFVFVFVFDHNGMHGYSSYQFSVSFRACCYLKILKCFPQSVEMIFFLQIVWKIILLRTEKKFKKGGGGHENHELKTTISFTIKKWSIPCISCLSVLQM